MQVSAVSSLVGDRLGGQARPQAAAECHPADRLTEQHMVVGGTQRVGVPDRELMLAVAEFGVVVLDLEALLLHGRDQFHDERVPLMEAGRGVAQAVVDGDEPVRDARRGGRHLPLADGELGLERGLHPVTLAGQFGQGLLEERARARLPRRPVGLDQVREHRAGARSVGKSDERFRVRHDPDLADRPHPGYRLQLVQHGHSHHRHRVPDAAGHPLAQPRGAGGLPADDPAVVGVEEADQANLLLACPLHHRFDRSVCHVPMGSTFNPAAYSRLPTCPLARTTRSARRG